MSEPFDKTNRSPSLGGQPIDNSPGLPSEYAKVDHCWLCGKYNPRWYSNNHSRAYLINIKIEDVDRQFQICADCGERWHGQGMQRMMELRQLMMIRMLEGKLPDA